MRDLLDGLFLMCVGMGTVFVFLGLLITVTEAIRVTCGDPAPAGGPPASGAGGGDDAAQAAATAAAVAHHRKRHRG